MNYCLERRKFSRVAVPADDLFVYCHETDRIAKVKDVSLGGFKIGCYPSAESIPDSITIDIYYKPLNTSSACGGEIPLPNQERLKVLSVPCRVIYNIASLAENSTFSGFESRAFGFKYEKLEADQKDRLEKIINFLTTIR